MVKDLSESTKKLAQAERDNAWSQMARQVAHEIKNPLTPIKLQIQRLIRLKEKNNPAWEERFDEVSAVVLEHIDILTETANEFSTFAKLYSEDPVLIDLNKILKDQGYDQSLLEVIDMRMSALADPIFHARKRFVEDLKPIVAQYYKAVSGGSEMVDIEYESELFKAPLDQILASSYERDRIMKHTTSGIHRDDFAFRMNGHPIRRYGSQGQQKSFLVSLKFAQYEIMKQKYGFAPMLLLDDVFDKLDMGRISNLLQMVASNDFGQIFITDSNKVRMSGIVDRLTQDRAYFETVSGTFSRL
jgi:DNA replication and repair protein RecF